ncbi:hypothetical protein R6Q57_018746 [Mikania cordata]
MNTLRSLFTFFILHVALMVHAQQDDQSDFISIDCGIPQGSNYTDKRTGITSVSDAGFVEGGVSGEISSAYNYERLDLHLATLRSFPQNTRNCYTLRPKQGKNNRYLIRLRFLYGDYDSRAIELRLLDISMHEPLSTSLNLVQRRTYGSNERVRYADDRIWNVYTIPGTRTIQTTSNTISPGPLQQVASKVMSTANTPTISTDNLLITWNTTDTYIFYLHFAEVEILRSNQTREFNIFFNGNYLYGPPLSPSTKLEINQTPESTLPPLINALEIYIPMQFQLQKTEDQDGMSYLLADLFYK